MQLEELFYFRRSTRKYHPEQIKDEELEKIVDAALTAPLAMGNHQKTHLTVVQNPDLMAKIRACCETESRKHPGKMLDPLHGAPTLIFVSSKDLSSDHIEYCDVACIIENMILEATNLGLGSCYIWGCLPKIKANEEVMEALKLPEGHEILSGFVCGYPVKPLYAREKKESFSVNKIL